MYLNLSFLIYFDCSKQVVNFISLFVVYNAMNPILLNLYGFEIRWYGLLLALAFLIGYLILLRLGKEKGIEKEIIEKFVLSLVIAMIIGARLFEVFFYDFNYYFNNPVNVLYIWEGGIASHGALIGAVLVIFWFSKKYKIKFYDLADMIAIPIVLGAVFVRIGNFINSELIGITTTSKFGVNVKGVMRHPVQLYQSFTHFITILVLLFLRKKRLKRGMLFWSGLLMFSVFRFFTEFYKDLPIWYGLHLYGLNLAQYLSIGIFIASVIFLIKLKK